MNTLFEAKEYYSLDEESAHYNLLKIIKGSTSSAKTLFGISTKLDRRMIFANSIVSIRWGDNKRNRAYMLFNSMAYRRFCTRRRNLRTIRTDKMLIIGIDKEEAKYNMNANIKNKIY